MVLGLVVAPAAQANPLDMLYAPLHVHGTSQPESFIQSHFPTVSVSAGQLKKGWHSQNTGLYQGPAPRSAPTPSPGTCTRRVALAFTTPTCTPTRDGPLELGLAPAGRAQLRRCPAVVLPGRDGDGRLPAHVGEADRSESWWIQQTTAEANYVEDASSAWTVMANNLITVTNPKFAVGFEMFARVSAAQSLQVLRNTRCYCFAKLGDGRALRVHVVPIRRRGRRPHQRGHRLADRQVVGLLSNASNLGSPTGDATISNGVITRQFTNGTVVVNNGSSTTAVAVARAGTTTTVAPHDGKIILDS